MNAIWRLDRRWPAASGVALLVSLLGCHRDRASDANDAGPVASARPPEPSPPTTEPSSRPAPFAGIGPLAGEPMRHVVRDREQEPALRPFMSRVRNHFKDNETPLVVQRASLFGGGAASLVTELRDSDVMPLLLVEDRERHLLWERERPTVAMIPPVRDPVVIGRPKGGVALFAFDVPVRVVAGRFLDADGTPFADLNVIQADECQKLSAGFWPRHGMVVVCTRLKGSLLQLIRDDYTLAYAPEGIPIGLPYRLPASVSIAFDEFDTIVIAQYATRAGKDHLVALRYDAQGRDLWNERDLGEVARVDAPVEHLAMTESADGARIELARGAVEIAAGDWVKK